MAGLERLFLRLLAADAQGVAFPSWEAEARAARAVRQALGWLLHTHRGEALAIHRHLIRGQLLPRRGADTVCQRMEEGIRRMRRLPEVQAALGAARPVRFADPGRPPCGWVSIRKASRLTGYTEGHLRDWVLAHHPEIRRCRVRGRVYARWRDVVEYAWRRYGHRTRGRAMNEGYRDSTNR